MRWRDCCFSTGLANESGRRMTMSAGSGATEARLSARSRWGKTARILIAVLQLLIPAFANVADARAESESQRVHAHVEAYGTSKCPRDHDVDCIVCRLIHSGAATERPATVVPRIALLVDNLPARREISCTPTRLAGDPPQRAPPA